MISIKEKESNNTLLQKKDDGGIKELLLALQKILERMERIEGCVSKIEEFYNLSQKDTLTLGECAKYLQCSESTLYRLVECKNVPHSRMGKKIYFDKKRVDAWLVEQSVTTRDEMRSIAETYCNIKRL